LNKTYREHFVHQSDAVTYEQTQYAPRSAGELLWQIEKLYLTEIVDKLQQSSHKIEYLDFACGTGRIIAFLEDYVETATGIEISPEMLALAQKKLKKGSLLCKDVTASNDNVEGSYDLITAFRFILNAEASLRLTAFKALAARLKNESSQLVFNNHGNPLSYKGLFWPYHRVRQVIFGTRREGNYMTNHQVRELLDEAGLEVVQVIGMGFISPKIMPLLPYELCEKIERLLAGKAIVQAFGVNQLFVARRKCS
jgi:predicted TPR repeat methyltransferase